METITQHTGGMSMDTKILSFPDGKPILDQGLPIVEKDPEWSMRDNFAVAALEGFLASGRIAEVDISLVRNCYTIAHHMMQERKK